MHESKAGRQIQTAWLAGSLAVIALIAAACGGGGDGDSGFDDPRLQTFADQGRNHFGAVGMTIQTYADLTGFVGYNSIPPTSGPHDPVPLRCGIYRDDQRIEQAVHTMEHGAIIEYYQPEAFSPDEEAELRALALQLRENDERLVLTPNRQLESRITLTAWGVMLTLDDFEADTITDFVKHYSGRFNPEGFSDLNAC